VLRVVSDFRFFAFDFLNK